MSHTTSTDHWAEINGGLRGSLLLRAGALFTILATGQYFASVLLTSPTGQASGKLVASSWLFWIAALWLLAAGFIWVGVQPFLGRFGLATGIFHLLNGVFLLLVLFAGVKPFLPNASLAIGRTLLLLFFVLAEYKHLKGSHVWILAGVALLQFLKIGLRISDQLPALSQKYDVGLDSLLLSLLAVAVYLMAGDLHHQENQWARKVASTRAKGLAEFNNPEHDWNRSDNQPE